MEFPGLAGVVHAKEEAPHKLRLLINNAIHPGEPCGVDASLALARQLLGQPALPPNVEGQGFEQDPDAAAIWPVTSRRSWEGAPANWEQAIVAIIPFYNVGGVLDRGCCSRANQNGPEAYGFRGNARNFDLNRDFMKMDTQNAESFARFYTAFDPDVFIDTHTTNGADYPYTMTCITTQPDKAGPEMGEYLRDRWDPNLYAAMESVGYPMSPYVYSLGATPDSGLVGFLETPRYSTGYGALWGSIGLTAEAHMLKPFPERVQAMLNLIQNALALGLEDREAIKTQRDAARAAWLEADSLPIRWERNETDSTPIQFTGYTARYEPSAITGAERLRYDRESPWTATIPFFNHYAPSKWARVPAHYVIPAGWLDVVKRLRANGVALRQVESPATVDLEVTELVDYSSSKEPYEGHHVNRALAVERSVQAVQLQPGDWLVPTAQPAVRYIVEALELEAHDSFWTWGAFDSAMQRKEGFSAYVFEDTAAALLEQDPDLARAFDAAQTEHPEWKDDPASALRWIYEHSPYSESGAGWYPVMKTLD